MIVHVTDVLLVATCVCSVCTHGAARLARGKATPNEGFTRFELTTNLMQHEYECQVHYFVWYIKLSIQYVFIYNRYSRKYYIRYIKITSQNAQ